MAAFVGGRNFTVSINLHSYGESINLPYGCRRLQPSMTPEMDQRVKTLADGMAQYNGYEVGRPWETTLYPVNGDMGDWMVDAHGIVALSPEVGPHYPTPNGVSGFWPPLGMIQSVAEQNIGANTHALWAAGAHLVRLGVQLDPAARSAAPSRIAVPRSGAHFRARFGDSR